MKIRLTNYRTLWLLISAFQFVSVSVFSQNVRINQPDAVPVPVKIMSGGTGGGGDASAANQTATQANPGSDATKATAVQGVTGGKAVPISAATLPLPSGAATSANQTTANTSLASVSTNTGAASTIASGQVALSTSATQVIAAEATRTRILLRNVDTTISIYVGGSGVTSANGMLLKAGESMTVRSSPALYAIAASGTPTIAYFNEKN